MSQREIKEKLNYIIKKYGTTQQFIATGIGVNRTTINLFLKDKRDLHSDLLSKLENWINERI